MEMGKIFSLEYNSEQLPKVEQKVFLISNAFHMFKVALKMPKSNTFKSGKISVSFYLTLTSNPWDKPFTACPLPPANVQYSDRPLGDVEMCAAEKWSWWVWHKENKVISSKVDPSFGYRVLLVLRKGWSWASDKDSRHILSSNQKQITAKRRPDLYSLCSSIQKERQVRGHHAVS